jgi:hypothetical protein
MRALHGFQAHGVVADELCIGSSNASAGCIISCRARAAQGHLLLVGVGGSGKQSLARLAAFAAGCAVFEIQLKRGYGRAAFQEDLKALYTLLGQDNQKARLHARLSPCHTLRLGMPRRYQVLVFTNSRFTSCMLSSEHRPLQSVCTRASGIPDMPVCVPTDWMASALS